MYISEERMYSCITLYVTHAVSNGICIVERSSDIYHACMHVIDWRKRKQCDRLNAEHRRE